MKDKQVSFRVSEELHKQINQTAQEDYRKQADQLSYLLSLGLKTREQMKNIEAGNTQIDPARLREKA